MKSVPIFFLVLFIFFGFLSCNKMDPNVKYESASTPISSTESTNIVAEDATLKSLATSSAAKVSSLDSLRKFIRTAEIRGEVNDVVSSTTTIENIAAQQGGFVISSNLRNNHHKNVKPISRDSALEIISTNLQSDLVIRVPFRLLDSTLRAIARQIKLFDYRKINAHDVTLDEIEQELIRVSSANLSEQIAVIGTQAGNTTTRIEAADRAAQAKNAEQAAWLKNKRTEDQVQFSTITIAIYENQRTKTTKIANNEMIAQDSSFGYELASAFRAGWQGLGNVFIALMHLWPLYMVVGIFSFLMKNKGVKINSKNK
jgi:hypothetical protein